MVKPLLISLMLGAAAPAFACAHYDQPGTTLSGTVRIETFYGPPGYGETPGVDAREQQAILHLTEPLCTVASSDDRAERGQTRVTLVPMGPFSLLPFEGKAVTLRGRLLHALTGHHHTPVLIAIDDLPVEAAPSAASTGLSRQ
jgi:hypothetical protein